MYKRQPIQGTAADIIKLSMIEIHKYFKEKKINAKMILQVHDELVFEVPKSEIEILQSMVVEEMEKSLPISVPIVVDCGYGKSWYEAH